MATHISSYFHQELETVRTEVMHMGGLVERQLSLILQSLENWQESEVSEVIDIDGLINQLEVQIDEYCQNILVRRQPAASDLRLVLTVTRIISDLERMGDELKKIAFIIHDLHSSNVTANQLYDTHRIAQMTMPMVRSALDAFARLDDGMIISLDADDKKLDTEYRNQSRMLATYMMEEPRFISVFINIMMINKSLERVGDHAKNIAEHVVYLVRGIDIRHQSLDKLQIELKSQD